MAILSRILVWSIVAAILFVGVSFLLPREVIVTRIAQIDAAPGQVYSHLHSMQAQMAWSPWTALDPGMQLTYSGPETGAGNRLEWESEFPTVGKGRQTILDVVENEQVRSEVELANAGPAMSLLRLSATNDGTMVEWNFRKDLGFNPVARWTGLSIQGAVEGDYAAGLDRLKSLAEGG